MRSFTCTKISENLIQLLCYIYKSLNKCKFNIHKLLISYDVRNNIKQYIKINDSCNIKIKYTKDVLNITYIIYNLK